MATLRTVNDRSVKDDLTIITKPMSRKFPKVRGMLSRSSIVKKTRVVHVNYIEEDEKNIPEVIEYLKAMNYRGGIDFNEKRNDVIIGVNGTTKIVVRFILQKPSGSRQQVPTSVQEEGSTVVFNRALRDNIKFPTKESILEDDDTREALYKVFKGYEHRLPLWTHTYWQQQKQFLSKYSGVDWDVFVYEGNDFVTFFRKELPRITRDPDTGQKVGDYTTWNPSDIYAAQNLKEIQKNIRAKIPTEPQHLAQLNNYLAKLMNEKQLVGISLKMINKEDPAHIKLLNDTDKHYSLTEVTKFQFPADFTYKLDNIFDFKDDKQSTTVSLGKGKGRYEINIRRAGDNIIWATSIKATPAAQGGNAPVDMVLKHMGTGFDNKALTMPQDGSAFLNKSSEFEKMWNDVSDNMNRPPKWEDFQKDIIFLYAKDSRSAKVKLLQLKFWSHALKKVSSLSDNKKKAEWWKDLLYLGLKVGKKGMFAPHAKIS